MPPIKVVTDKSRTIMTLDEAYNKWLAIQPLSEADQNKLSMRFTVEYNYNSLLQQEARTQHASYG